MTGISPTGALTVASHPKFGSRAAFDCHGVDPLVCKEFRNGGLHVASVQKPQKKPGDAASVQGVQVLLQLPDHGAALPLQLLDHGAARHAGSGPLLLLLQLLLQVLQVPLQRTLQL